MIIQCRDYVGHNWLLIRESEGCPNAFCCSYTVMFNIPISGSERKEEMDECEERVDMPAGLYACLVNEKSLCCNM